MARETQTKILIRLPDDVKVWLQEQSEKNFSSQNSEIVRAIRERMDRLRPADQASA